MGCNFNFQQLNAKTDAEAIKEGHALIETAAYEHGHGGYSGSFAECRGVDLVKTKTPPEEIEDWLDTTAEKWGPMLVVKSGGHYFAGANCSD